ncbi:MAG: nucleoside triphosphate pyrophosphatase [Christensenellaceae bacterium]
MMNNLNNQNNEMKLILASNSPRRREILTEFGYDFTVKTSDFKENDMQGDPVSVAMRFAKGKALGVFLSEKRLDLSADIAVIGADTVVYFDGKILGKPKDKAEAYKTLKALSGKMHAVVTGFAVISERLRVFGYDVSEVVFNDLSEKTVSGYVATGNPLDKAGSYGVQDGFDLVREVRGSVYNVIGFPIEKIKFILDGFNNLDK